MTRSIQRLLLLCAFAVAGAGCATSEPLIPPTPLEQIQRSVKLDAAWSIEVGKNRRAASFFVPAEAGDQVYAASSDGSVIAVDKSRGKVLWRRSLSERLSSGVTVDEQHVYVAERDGKLRALNREDGSDSWSYSMSSEILRPVAAAFGRVVSRSADGRIVGLDAIDGNELWRNSYTPPALTVHGYSSPSLLPNGVLVGLDDGKIVALTLDDGKTLWESQLSYPNGRSEVERLVDVDAEILVDNQALYAVNYQGKLARIEPARGRQIWSVEFSSVVGMAQAEGTLFVVDDTDRVVALSKDSGAILWEQSALVGRKLTQPLTKGTGLLVADLEGFVHVLAQSDGSLTGRYKYSKKAALAPPVAGAQGVLMQSAGGQLTLLKTGS